MPWIRMGDGPRRKSQRSRPRSYGESAAAVQLRLLALVAAVVLSGLTAGAAAAERPLAVVVLGDSLSAGYGLSGPEAFPAQLERALAAKGHSVSVANAGASGDTASGGLARVDWSVPEGTEAVILELGANDALRGIDPAITREALTGILRRLAERRIPVMLAGMQAPRNLGRDYVQAFDGIYPALARAFDVVFYPFFLDGVAVAPALNQPDGMHPTAAGVAVIVERILPQTEELLARARAARAAKS